jgi:hypothetical protein
LVRPDERAVDELWLEQKKHGKEDLRRRKKICQAFSRRKSRKPLASDMHGAVN